MNEDADILRQASDLLHSDPGSLPRVIKVAFLALKAEKDALATALCMLVWRAQPKLDPGAAKVAANFLTRVQWVISNRCDKEEMKKSVTALFDNAGLLARPN